MHTAPTELDQTGEAHEVMGSRFGTGRQATTLTAQRAEPASEQALFAKPVAMRRAVFPPEGCAPFAHLHAWD